jgi:hypothetical protein
MHDDKPRRGRAGIAAVKLFFALLAATYMTLGIVWTWRAPCGAWDNRIFGFAMWQDNDPGGWYIPAAHEALSRPGRTCFHGHPGVPLVLLLSVEQAASYGLGHLADSRLSFTQYTARHVREVWIAAKIGSVVLHLLCFAALYVYARAITRRRDLALLATATYATSFPVLYFLNRVSVEPLMNLFFLSTIVCVVRSEKAGPGAPWPAIWAAAAGVCSVSAFFTKIHLMAAWPVWAGIGILLGVGAAKQRPLLRRLALLGAFGAGALGATLIYNQFVDWQAFASFWQQIRPLGAPVADASFVELLLRGVRSGATTLLRAFGHLTVKALMPACTAYNCFFFFELLSGLAVLVGLVRGPRSRLLAWTLGYCLFVGAIWLYRTEGTDFRPFHYLFPVVAALAPLAAIGLATLFPAIRDETRPRFRRGVEIGSLVIALHAAGFFAVLDSKSQDADEYRRRQSGLVLDALSRLGPTERIAVPGYPAYSFHGLTDEDAMPGRESTLLRELKGLLLWKRHAVDRARSEEGVSGQPTTLVIDLGPSDPAPQPATSQQGMSTVAQPR